LEPLEFGNLDSCRALVAVNFEDLVDELLKYGLVLSLEYELALIGQSGQFLVLSTLEWMTAFCHDECHDSVRPDVGFFSEVLF
jgi:hypothetical protein